MFEFFGAVAIALIAYIAGVYTSAWAREKIARLRGITGG